MRDLRADAFTSIGHELPFITFKRTSCFECHGISSATSISVEKVMLGVRRSVGRARCRNQTTSVFVFGSASTRELYDFTQGELCHSKRSTSSRAPRGSGGFGDNTRLPRVVEPYMLDELLWTPLAPGESLGARICNIADGIAAKFQALVDGRCPDVLSGPYAPVCETEPMPCRVARGRIPADLDGVYLRNGPNPLLMERGERLHLFDGDGMIHSVTLRGDGDGDGRALYCARFVRTSRFAQEQAGGRPVVPRFFGAVCGGGGGGIMRILVLALRVALGVFDTSRGLGASNAAVAIFGGRVLSLSEDDMPYVLDVAAGDGDVRTLGRLELPSKINLCAHPKIDPATGDMYAFGLDGSTPFSYSVFRVSARGAARITGDAPVPLPDLPLVHDFAVTPRFVVFPDGQLVVRPSALAVGRSPLACDSAKTPRFCLLPKHDGLSPEHSTAHARLFDAPGVNCLHCLNAWDDDHEVVLVAPVLSPPDRILVIPQNTASRLTEIRFDTMTGGVKRRAICSDLNLEFGVINPEYSSHKTRFAYMGCGSYPYFDAVVKVDLTRYGGEEDEQGPIVGRRDFGQGMYGGEPFFVAAKDAKSEDHGYILCLVGDRKGAQASELWVMDALSPSLEIIAVIELVTRVPVGFHGCFIARDQLAQQKL